MLLLCTDGLYDMVPDDRLQEVLSSTMSAELTCRKLIDLANENGGNDNITVIVARFLVRRSLTNTGRSSKPKSHSTN